MTDSELKLKNERYDELWRHAVGRMMDKLDLDLYDWFIPAEFEEFIKLELDLGLLEEEDYKSMKGEI